VIDIALQIVGILAPSFLLAFIGLVWFYKGPDFHVPFVTTLVMNLALPALLFHTLTNTTVAITALGTVAMATLVLHIIFAGVAFALLKIAGKDWRLSISHIVGNTGNLGLPVCFLAFGDEGLAYAIAFFSVQCFLLFSIGEGIIAGTPSVKRMLQSPILHAVWLGVLCRVFTVEMPAVVDQTLELLGQTVIPIMLITLGFSLASMRAAQLSATVFWSGVRTLVALVIGFGVARLFGLDGVAGGVVILQTVMPVAVFNYLLAAKYGRDSSEVSGMILVTHLAAIIYLPLILFYVL